MNKIETTVDTLAEFLALYPSPPPEDWEDLSNKWQIYLVNKTDRTKFISLGLDTDIVSIGKGAPNAPLITLTEILPVLTYVYLKRSQHLRENK